MALETSLFYRVLIIRDKQYKVEAPKVGLSLQLLYVMDHPKEPDFENVFLSLIQGLEFKNQLAFAEILRIWKIAPFEVVKAVKKMITQGYDLPKRVESETDDSGKKQEWSEILMEFSHIYQVDPLKVVVEYPFPFFMEMYNQIGKLKYRKRIENGLATGFGSGAIKEEFTTKWFDRAGYTEKKEKPKTEKVAYTPEEIENKINQEYELLKQRI